MSFAAVMPCSGGVGGFRIPAVHGKIGVSTSNHEPVGGIRSHESTDLTPEFLQRCHGSLLTCQWLVGPARDRGLSQIWCQNREFPHLFPVRGTTQVGGVVHHPNLGND